MADDLNHQVARAIVKTSQDLALLVALAQVRRMRAEAECLHQQFKRDAVRWALQNLKVKRKGLTDETP